MALTPNEEAAVIYDNLLTGLVRLQVHHERRARFLELIKECSRDLQEDIEGIDGWDRMLIDVFGVLQQHLEFWQDKSITTRVPAGGPDITRDLKDYKILCRKVEHRCIDMSCSLCDKEE